MHRGKHGKKDPEPTKEDGFFESYSFFAKTLRNWLVAYGIGAISLLITQAPIRDRLLEAGVVGDLLELFLVGVICQVAAALLYKTAMWHLYMGEVDATTKTTRIYRIMDWASEAYLLEITFDIGAMGMFGAGTLLAASLFRTPLERPADEAKRPAATVIHMERP